jgi:hypothetical protein
MNINSTFQLKKVRKMQNLGNVYIWGRPFAKIISVRGNPLGNRFSVVQFIVP